MIKSSPGVNASSLNITGESWATKTSGFSAGSIRTAMCFDRQLSSYPFTSGIYFVAGDGGQAFKTSTTVKSYNESSAWSSVTSSFGSTPIYGSDQGSGGEYAYLVGGSGKMARSLRTGDLSTWTQVTSSFVLTPIFDIVGHNWLYVSVGADGKLATKNDHFSAGNNVWTQRTSSFGTNNIYSVTVGTARLSSGMRYVAVGEGGLIATWDTLGYNNSDSVIYQNSWTQRANIFGTTDINSIAWSEKHKIFVAVGDNGLMAQSEDAVTWYLIGGSPFGTSNINAVTSTGEYGDIFVAAGDGGKLATSTDGSIWTLRSSGFSGSQPIRCLSGNSTTAIAGGDAGVVSITPTPPAVVVTPVEPPPAPPTLAAAGATGGTITEVSNYNGSGQTWRIHSFSSSGSLVVSGVGTASCLAVGGGGGGHGGSAGIFGSGGNGGAVVSTTVSLSIGTYSVTVGTGGSGGAYQGSPSGAGGASSVSGTGVSVNATGGAGRTSSENGQDGTGASGSGRTGVTSSITGTAVGRGGGGGYALNVGNRGFVDGGGPGGDVSVNLGTPGVDGTGGGGGGSYNNSNPGRNGGSGIVIIAYRIS